MPPDPPEAPADIAGDFEPPQEEPVALAEVAEEPVPLAEPEPADFEEAPEDELEPPEDEPEPLAATPEAPARPPVGSSLRPLTIDPKPPVPLDDEHDELVSLLPVSRLPATRRIVIPVAIALAGCVVAFAARRLVAPKPSDARQHEIPAAEIAAVDALPIPPEPADIDDSSGEDPAATSEEQIELGRKTALEARRLLEAGQIEQGVAEARKAIALNPQESRNYILLAAGLQDLGKWQEAKEIFARCTKQSNGVANRECIYFATHSR